jgi:hypothetical protein
MRRVKQRMTQSVDGASRWTWPVSTGGVRGYDIPSPSGLITLETHPEEPLS